MPTYVLHCHHCGKSFELESRISTYLQSRDSGSLRCPSCSSAEIEPQLMATSIITSKKS